VKLLEQVSYLLFIFILIILSILSIYLYICVCFQHLISMFLYNHNLSFLFTLLNIPCQLVCYSFRNRYASIFSDNSLTYWLKSQFFVNISHVIYWQLLACNNIVICIFLPLTSYFNIHIYIINFNIQFHSESYILIIQFIIYIDTEFQHTYWYWNSKYKFQHIYILTLNFNFNIHTYHQFQHTISLWILYIDNPFQLIYSLWIATYIFILNFNIHIHTTYTLIFQYKYISTSTYNLTPNLIYWQ
jgi:hypothetical protein